MKKRKMKAWKVMTTAAMTSLLFSSLTVFAEGDVTPAESQMAEEIGEQRGQLFFDKDKIETGQEDSLYKDVKKEGLATAYKPNDTVRLIVEVEQPTEIEQTAKSKKALYKQKQDKVIEQISKEKNSQSNAPIKVKHRFFKGFNGFSVETEFQNIKDIQSISVVANVHIARTFQENMAASKELVQAQKVREQYGYKGEGLVVAVVDSGIDYTHKDMKLSDTAKAKEKWTQDKINQKFAETDVNEIWYSDKVPTGYDWADNDTNVIPGTKGSPHGTHVAGTIGANGDETKGGVAGIAPGVQLLAEKVFSDNGGGAYEDDIIAGIEHAVTMGADVINMSLGVDAGYVDEDFDPIQKSIRVATEQGTLVVVAAGNTAYSTKNNIILSSLRPYAENPDIGTVGAPGVSPYALSVASYENSKLHLNALADASGFSVPFKDQTQFPASYNFKFSKVLSPEVPYDLVYVGEGKNASDYPKGKTDYIAVVKLLNSYSTVSSIQWEAKRSGAKAVIIIPPANWSDYTTLPVTPTAAPTASTSKAAGEALLSKMNSLPSGQYLSMKFAGNTWVENPAKDTMSYFSSFGSPSRLDFKPEISAPGGNIYSTIPGNDYEVMSGTSMAAPHVAGGSALLLQALYQKGLTHSEDTVLKAKIALMNTANFAMDPRTNGEVPYSPRVQGSGIMKIQNAINTPVIVTSRNTPLEQAGAVALKEIGQNTSFNLIMEAFDTLKGKNNSDDIEYNVYVDLLKDKTEMKEFDLDSDGQLDSKEYLTLTSERINGATVTVNDNVVTDKTGALLKIKPGQTKMLTVNVTLPDSLKKNSFVEGFVRLVPAAKDQDKAVPLTVPYMGFYGKWDEPRNIDAPAWEKDAFVGYTALWDENSERYPLGYNPYTGRFSLNHIAFSKNYILDGIYPSFQALRNLDKAEMYIEDQSGNLIKNLGDFSEYTGTPWKFRKNIMSYGDRMYGGYKWDMKDSSGQYVPDGVYQYVTKTTLDYSDAKPQIVKMPITVDSVPPTVSDITVTQKNGKYEISFNPQDNASDFNSAVVWVNGQYYSLSLEQKSFLVNTEPKSIIILAIDYAGNQSYKVWGDPSYIKYTMAVQTFSLTPAANINKSKPANINAWAYARADWTINVKDASGKIVDSFEVKNEHTLKTQWVPNTDLQNGTYSISIDVVTKDGFKVTTTPKQVTVLQQ
ncbi:S8 family serine peptidase [Metabacillus hrfriensis]|uniref:S8 family serine peptidase n=1 Tax=Metabacillus hrfriensis TaxID=3048891 RepID=A0ACD4R6D1_9BACI|nr:S8 family serine peptidase [Metabacillus sp. CT-WN-B3]WHZ56025.1 S8 family serine peptidase [Metabacillus sp. CT-WN-B3]